MNNLAKIGGKNVIFYLIGPCQDCQAFHIWDVRVLNPLLGYINFFKLGISGKFSDGSKARANPNLFRGFSKKKGKFCGTSYGYNIWGAKRSALSVLHCSSPGGVQVNHVKHPEFHVLEISSCT